MYAGRADAQSISACETPAWKTAASTESRACATADRGVGLATSDAGFIGAGPGYKASFDSSGITFVPALGRAAPRNLGLRFELTSAARGELALDCTPRSLESIEHADAQAQAAAAPRTAQASVRYARGALIEQYDLRGDGVEQSFRFDALPGRGDLVVRGRIATELSLVASSSTELRFEQLGLGGVRIGAVTGVDANGARASGWLRCVGDELELGLPAAFVDRAALPLVLDPLIGATIVVTPSPSACARPDLAYDITTERYLIAWDVVYSMLDADIQARMLASDGTPLGNLLLVDSGSNTFSIEPAVANVNTTDRYLVAWEEDDNEGGPQRVLARSVSAQNQQMSAILVIDNTGRAPQLGGELSLIDDDALLVWTDIGPGTNELHIAEIRVPLSADPVIANDKILATTDVNSRASITRHGGYTGQYLVAWDKVFASQPLDRDIRAMIVSRDLVVIATPFTLANSVRDEARPRCDGDGASFVTVWQRESAAADHDIRCRRVYDTGPSYALDPEKVIVEEGTLDEIEPDIAFAGSKYVVAWSHFYLPGDYDVYMKTIGPTSCTSCEPTVALDLSTIDDRRAAIASDWWVKPGGGDDHALVAWTSSSSTTGSGTVKLQAVDAIGAGGGAIDLGGGCGNGGTIGSIGAVALGNTNFALTLDSAPSPLALLNLSVGGSAPLACGTCAWNPFLVVQSFATSGGHAGYALAIPCDTTLIGAQVEAQWTSPLAPSSPCSLAPNTALSNRLRLTIGT